MCLNFYLKQRNELMGCQYSKINHENIIDAFIYGYFGNCL